MQSRANYCAQWAHCMHKNLCAFFFFLFLPFELHLESNHRMRDCSLFKVGVHACSNWTLDQTLNKSQANVRCAVFFFLHAFLFFKKLSLFVFNRNNNKIGKWIFCLPIDGITHTLLILQKKIMKNIHLTFILSFIKRCRTDDGMRNDIIFDFYCWQINKPLATDWSGFDAMHIIIMNNKSRRFINKVKKKSCELISDVNCALQKKEYKIGKIRRKRKKNN